MSDSKGHCVCVTVDVDDEHADDATSRLFELGSSGVEWRDATTLAGSAPGTVTLVASFERALDAKAAMTHLPATWAPRFEEVAADAWRDEWKKYFEPFRIAPNLVVAPPWRPVEPNRTDRVLVLEPGRAFGTGLHETTSLAAEALSERAARFRGAPILDVGCGSGILALVALALGAGRATAIDVDPEAVRVTRENADRNGLTASLEASDAPLESVMGSFAAVVANIEAKTLVDLAPRLVERVSRDGFLVLSGILSPDAASGQLDTVRAAYAMLEEEDMRRKGDWVALVLRM